MDCCLGVSFYYLERPSRQFGMLLKRGMDRDSLMYSIARSHSSDYSDKLPLDEYQGKETAPGRTVGIKRVETKLFVRFERLIIAPGTGDSYLYQRSSDWFVNVPFCRTDKQIFLANALFVVMMMLIVVSSS